MKIYKIKLDASNSSQQLPINNIFVEFSKKIVDKPLCYKPIKGASLGSTCAFNNDTADFKWIHAFEMILLLEHAPVFYVVFSFPGKREKTVHRFTRGRYFCCT